MMTEASCSTCLLLPIQLTSKSISVAFVKESMGNAVADGAHDVLRPMLFPGSTMVAMMKARSDETWAHNLLSRGSDSTEVRGGRDNGARSVVSVRADECLARPHPNVRTGLLCARGSRSAVGATVAPKWGPPTCLRQVFPDAVPVSLRLFRELKL